METPSRGGWIALLLAGVLDLLYGLVYLVWSILGLIGGGVSAIANLPAILDNGADDPVTLAMTVLALVMPIVSIVVFVVVPVMSLITVLAAFRFRAFRSKGLVWLGILAGVGAPALGLVSSLTACLNCACVGFLLGNVGTIPVLLVAGGLAAYAAFVLTRPEIAEAFAEDA
jgi:hypothetical protein